MTTTVALVQLGAAGLVMGAARFILWTIANWNNR